MAEPVQHHFKFYQGATFAKIVTWQESDGTPIPLTQYKARMQVRTKPRGRIMLNLTTENGGITLEPGGATGEIHLFASAAQTALMNVDGVYDLELEDENDSTIVERLIEGKATVSLQVTQ